MEQINNFSLLKAFFIQSAFGKSGRLKSDLIQLSKRKRYTYSVFVPEEGGTIIGDHGTDTLFGGRSAETVLRFEMLLPTKDVDSIKEEILSLIEGTKDSIFFSQEPLQGFVNDERLIEYLHTHFGTD